MGDPPPVPDPCWDWADFGLQFFRAAPEVAIVGDANTGNIVLWNAAAERLFGHLGAEVVGRSLEVLVPVALVGPHRGGLARFAATGHGTIVDGGAPVELPALHRNGQEMRIELTLAPLAHAGRSGRYVLAQVRDVTQRQQALDATRARLAAIVDASDDAIYSVTPDRVITSWNPAAERMFGYPAAEAIGQPLTLIATSDREPELDRIVERLGRGEPVIHHETERRTKDGKRIDVAVTVSALRDMDGTLAGTATIARDVTEHKRHARALQQAEARLQAVWDTTSDAIVLIDREGVILMANPAHDVLFGVTQDETIGFPFSKFLQPDQREARLVHHRERTSRGDEPLRLAATIKRAGGETRRVQLVIDDLRLDGEVTATVVSMRDITEQMQAELAQRTSEERYRLLVEQLPAVVYVMANDGIQPPLYMSPQVEQLLGRSVASLMQREVSWLARVHPDDLPRIVEWTHESISGRNHFDARYRFRRGDGSYVWVWDICVPIRDEAGTVTAWQGILFDVSEQFALQEQLVAARDAAEEANRLKSSFLSTMSHELRTPMNAIMGYAHVLLEGLAGALNPDQRQAAGEIADGADRLLGLINDVLDLSRIESGGLDLVWEAVDLGHVLAAVQADLAPMAQAKGIDLVVDLPLLVPTIDGDEQRIRQILLNLAGNAVKFTERGQVTIGVAAEPNRVAVAVRDTGIGIDARVVPYIFAEFRQADARTTRKYGGSGLGLAISKRLAELHGGSIVVESEAGTGSIFTLILPRNQAGKPVHQD